MNMDCRLGPSIPMPVKQMKHLMGKSQRGKSLRIMTVARGARLVKMTLMIGPLWLEERRKELGRQRMMRMREYLEILVLKFLPEERLLLLLITS